MAKKAKRRGRPPGSKNKKRGRPPGSKNKKKVALPKVGKSVASMDVGQLKAYIDGLEQTLAAKVQQQREILEGQLAGLQGYVSQKAAGVVRTVLQVPRSGKRAKPKPKYQSKKDRSLKWSGRGMLPIWMRDEMKGTKLTKDDFLIK
jgi:DNA-binding protein H-NS